MQTRRGREENILNVLVQVLQGNGRQPLLGLQHVSDIVLRDVQVRRDIRWLELLDSELGLALLRLGNGDRVGRGRTVEGGEGSVGHLEQRMCTCVLCKVSSCRSSQSNGRRRLISGR
jgi:hypothetical protein